MHMHLHVQTTYSNIGLLTHIQAYIFTYSPTYSHKGLYINICRPTYLYIGLHIHIKAYAMSNKHPNSLTMSGIIATSI